MGKFDFSGWATRNDLLCADGRTIRKNAFKDCDGAKVPLVWNHQHNEVNNVLGHAVLENRDEGVYAYCAFNDSDDGKHAKEMVKHGDIRSLSIYANQLKQIGRDVIHGTIRELSLVMAGANPGAFIDFIMAHGDNGEESLSGFIADYDEGALMLYHSEENVVEKKKEENMGDNSLERADGTEKEKTIGEVFNTFTEEQKNVVYALIGQALEDAGVDTSEEGDENMKHNLFDGDEMNENILSHSDMMTIIEDGKKYGSLKDSFLAHSEDYGIDNIEYLFPEAQATINVPEFIKRGTDWVQVVMNATHHSPFSRVKTMFADLTEDAARAKGYFKGNLKKEEVFSLLKRGTTPTTIYKKQKMDRDDVIDITDFDVISWIKGEMRLMLDEEIARAILIGDGRLASDDDHIDTNCIRPIVNDADLFVIRYGVGAGSSSADKAKNFITGAIKARKDYKGSGTPTLFTTEDMLTDMLLLEDTIGHKLYKTESELATALRVGKIVTVPVLDNFQDKDSKDVYGIIVNLNDYTVGADKGGAINMFEDFDIDYNQQKYLIETRCSGALVKPFSAIVLRAGNNQSDAPTKKQAMDEFRN